jgi:predicted RNA-binding protein YlqC (UPF0109 family)
MAVKELIEYAVKKLVENPEKVTISEVSAEEKTVIQVYVAAHDIGRVIGSDGRTFRALRALINLTGDDTKYDLVVDITI